MPPVPPVPARTRRAQQQERGVYDAFEPRIGRRTALPGERDGARGEMRVVTLDDGRTYLCIRGVGGWQKLELD